MKVEELIEIIINILEENNDLEKERIEIDETCPLIGGGSSIDSMNLVQICLALEEKSLGDNFTFDWTSEKAMSSLNSIFKNPNSLTKEYNLQMKNSLKEK